MVTLVDSLGLSLLGELWTVKSSQTFSRVSSSPSELPVCKLLEAPSLSLCCCRVTWVTLGKQVTSVTALVG